MKNFFLLRQNWWLMVKQLSSLMYSTGEQSCTPPEAVCFVAGECEGILIETVASTSADQCLQLCNSTASCRWFTFQSEAAKCILFQSCDALDDSCSACVSGERRCIDSPVTTTTQTPTTTPPPKRKLIPCNNLQSIINFLTLSILYRLQTTQPS